MHPHPTYLLDAAGITTPLIGVYTVHDPSPFLPFTDSGHCIFSCYDEWKLGKSLVIDRNRLTCRGAGYWLFGIESRSRESFVDFLYGKEGLKCSAEVMNEWLDRQPPFEAETPYVVIGPLREDHEADLVSVTFFVTPDQLSVVLTAAEYHNPDPSAHVVTASFGSGCGQLAALLPDLKAPRAVIGGTDIAMREYLPPDLLTVTVTVSMYEKLCSLDASSFLGKPFLARLRNSRKNPVEDQA